MLHFPSALIPQPMKYVYKSLKKETAGTTSLERKEEVQVKTKITEQNAMTFFLKLFFFFIKAGLLKKAISPQRPHIKAGSKRMNNALEFEIMYQQSGFIAAPACLLPEFMTQQSVC